MFGTGCDGGGVMGGGDRCVMGCVMEDVMGDAVWEVRCGGR